jgi:hypothetical protein
MGRSFSSFHVCGCIGVLLAVTMAMTLVGHAGLSYSVMSAIVLGALLTFLGLVAGTKVITGKELIIYYHHEIGVMLVAAILVKTLHQPILPYLDITILGIGLFLACGRVGCLMVGCCHGRFCHWGICYREEHVAEGFAPYLAGVRLFPIQAVESLWVFFVVVCGTAYVLSGQPPGTALAWHTFGYGLARFCFEFARGDSNRTYSWGFSQAQWISLLLMIFVVGAEWSGLMPFHTWHAGAVIGVVVIMFVVALRRRFDEGRRFQILHPEHVSEVARAMELVSTVPQWRAAIRNRSDNHERPVIVCTSLGIQISGCKIESETTVIDYYAFSCRGARMSKETAVTLAGLIVQLRGAPASQELVGRDKGVFHLLLRPAVGTGLA